MITTTRLEKSNNDLYYGNDNVNVALLEKEAPSTYADFSSTNVEETEDFKQAKERMQKNLEKLLNYDRYSEVVEEEKQEIIASNESVCEDDIRPTSTTMQFGEKDEVNSMFDELRNEVVEKENKETSYKLNKKGKLAVCLYSVCVAIVLALIVLNTGLIAILSNQKQAYAEQLNSLMTNYSQKVSETEFAKSEENIIKLAEQVYNMTK